jgi:hypothetical protein
MENVMRLPVSYAALGSALGLALVAGGSAAHAQTVIRPAVVDQPVFVQTTETVRTIRPLRSRREVVTTRTITRRVVPTSTTTVVARIPAAPQPLYDEVAPASFPNAPQPIYDEVAPASFPSAPQPLYDEVAAPMAPAPMVDARPMIAGDAVATQPYAYRYVYQPDRILVIDPATGIAVRAIPR